MASQVEAPEHRRPQRRFIAAFIGSVAIALLVVACGGSSGGGSSAQSSSSTGGSTPSASAAASSVSAAELDATIETVLDSKGVSADSLAPLMKKAISIATPQLSDAQLQAAFACWQKSSCQLGSGKVTLAQADG